MTDDSEQTELIPETIRDLLRSCQEYIKRAVGTEADGTQETLPLVDHYVGITRSTLEERPQLLPLVTRALAAYVGELIRGTIGGFWHVPSEDAHEWLVCLSPVYMALSPMGIVYDAIYSGTSHDGPSSHLRIAREDTELVRERLDAVPPVPEDEFFLFSTRFEAIEVAVETLRAAMQAGGQEDMFFELDDYSDEFGTQSNPT